MTSLGISYDVSQLDSIAPLFGADDSRCGVYRLRFKDADAYVGKSRDVVKRFATHHRRWPDEIMSFEFFACPDEMLDDMERHLITETELESSVRNVLLTRRPHGDGEHDVHVEEKVSVSLPWQRTERVTPTDQFDEHKLKKWWAFQQHESYQDVVDILGWFVAETIPDPIRTAGKLWTLTCLPSTNKTRSSRRLATLSCGNLESCFFIETREGDETFVDVVLNSAPGDYLALTDAHRRWDVHQEFQYRIADTMSWIFPLENLVHFIGNSADFPHWHILLDGIYELNVQSMRRGSSMYSRFHNEPFTQDALLRALKLKAHS